MITVTGADEIRLVAASVRSLGTDRTIVKEMRKEMLKAVVPIRKAVKANALATLPSGGGLDVWTSKARISGTMKTAPKTAGLTVRGSKTTKGTRHDLKRLDQGRVRHMSWGRPPWHAQTVKPGFFTDAVTDEGKQQLHDAVIAAADKAAGVILYGR